VPALLGAIVMDDLPRPNGAAYNDGFAPGVPGALN